MKVIKADKLGFCFGVKRAVDMALSTPSNNMEISTFGPLIHNDSVTQKLKNQNIHIIHDLSEQETGTVIIRSHGVASKIYEEAGDKKLNLVDCTCPFVKKVHRIVKKYSDLNYKIIIVGDQNHPEVIGIKGWCKESLIINSIEAAKELPKNKYCVVAQTTLNQSLWYGIKEQLIGYEDIEFFNTICSATKERQEAAIDLAKKVDCMVVIGGYDSSNTKKLYEICKKICKNTVHIENKSDLVMTKLVKCGIIGITAGASTPNWIIDEVLDHLIQLDEDV
jgi:4-hydroxy-3-methylbut-2-enyl diphosphate reductase